jgi:hypothetical protein
MKKLHAKKSDRNVGMVRPGEILSRPMGKGGDGQVRKETLPHTLSSLARHDVCHHNKNESECINKLSF